MDSGKLVPDELLIDIVLEKLKEPDCQNKGWLLDGFPRTKVQADSLKSAGIWPDYFIFLKVPEEVVVDRVCSRRMDPETGKIYNLKYKKPETPEIEARLIQRSDDTVEKIKDRFTAFENNIDPILTLFSDVLIFINGDQKVEDIKIQVKDALNKPSPATTNCICAIM